MKIENEVTAMLRTDSPILISKERLNEYVKGDFAARVKLKLLSPAKATAMTVGGCGKVNFKSTSNEEADPAAQPSPLRRRST